MCDITEENLVGEESDKYQVVKEWLNDHIYDPLLSLEMLADALGYSTPYWSRFFSEKMQISFNEYVWQLRKEKAKEMLKRTSKSVKEIVMEVGYIDVSSFTRRFKHEEGVTPGQYKKLLATVLKEV